MLWDLLQQHQIKNTQDAVTKTTDSVIQTEGDVRILNRKVETLMLACQAMWELLREQGRLTDEQLLRRMQDVDLRDGTPDGKMRPDASTCPACARLNRARASCVYCGGPLPPGQHVFAQE
jgi:hypothetical protein